MVDKREQEMRDRYYKELEEMVMSILKKYGSTFEPIFIFIDKNLDTYSESVSCDDFDKRYELVKQWVRKYGAELYYAIIPSVWTDKEREQKDIIAIYEFSKSDGTRMKAVVLKKGEPVEVVIFVEEGEAYSNLNVWYQVQING